MQEVDACWCSVPREITPCCFLKSCSEFLNSALICHLYFSTLRAICNVIKEHANMRSSLIFTVASDTCFTGTCAKSPSVGSDLRRGGGGSRRKGKERRKVWHSWRACFLCYQEH